MKIPFVNLKAQLDRLKPELLARLEQVIDSRDFIQGRFVREFEDRFAQVHGVPHVVGCSNGTAAIALALEALGIGPGDEVITVSHTFIATAEAICEVGARPVFVDIDPDTYLLDPSRIEPALTPRTRAIVPVHLYGNPCDMAPILEVSRKNGLKVVEDCAQAHIATYRGRPVGSLGDAGTFSFYPAKNLGAIGDAGCIVTKDADLAGKLRKLRDHGRQSKYEHDIVGYNHRMDGIQGAILTTKLGHLQQWTEARQRNAARYREKLSPMGLKTIKPVAGEHPVWHLFVTEVDRRDEVVNQLQDLGIGTGVHYPLPLHMQPALRHLGYEKGRFPVTEAASRRVLSLPMCAELTEMQIDEVCRALGQAILP